MSLFTFSVAHGAGRYGLRDDARTRDRRGHPFPGRPLDVLIAEEDARAKASVSAFIESLRLRPLDTGDLAMTRWLEEAGLLLVGLARHGAGFNIDLGVNVSSDAAPAPAAPAPHPARRAIPGWQVPFQIRLQGQTWPGQGVVHQRVDPPERLPRFRRESEREYPCDAACRRRDGYA